MMLKIFHPSLVLGLYKSKGSLKTQESLHPVKVALAQKYGYQLYPQGL